MKRTVVLMASPRLQSNTDILANTITPDNSKKNPATKGGVRISGDTQCRYYLKNLLPENRPRPISYERIGTSARRLVAEPTTT